MDIKKAITAASVLTAVLAVSITSVSADELNSPEDGQRGPKGEVRAAIEAGDYSTFNSFYEERNGESFGEENFQVLLQAHELREAGDKEVAKALLDDAGIQVPHKKGQHNAEKREEFLSTLSDDQLAVMEEAKVLREAGDHEAAKELIESSGIEFPEKKANQKGGCQE